MILSGGSLRPSQIDTIADETPIFADANYYASSSLQLASTWAAYGAMYRTQLWVNTVIRKLAFGTARLPLDVKLQGDGNNNQVPVLGPLADLLARPNDRLDAFRLWLWTSSTYDLYGEAFWLKTRDAQGRVRELHPMNPKNVIIRRDPETGENFYVYSAGVRNVSLLPPIPATDVVPFLSFSPDAFPRGLSNLEPLRQTLLNEDAVSRANASWWARGARPAVVLKHPATLSEPAQERLKRNFNASHAGVDNMGGTALLEEGLDLQVVQLNAEEMQYIESRKLNREEVCGAYDVPPPVVHILDHATYSNITEQMRSMYRDTMAPRFALFESALNHHLVPDFDQTGRVFTRFNMDEVVRGDFEVRATAAAQLITNGVMKPSEARPMFGLPDAGLVADQLYGNAALVPLGTPAKRVTITEPVAPASSISAAEDQADQPVDATAALTSTIPPLQLPPAKAPAKAPSYRSLMSRLGRMATKDATRAKLVDEHAKAIGSIFDQQRTDAKAGTFDPTNWDDPLAQALSTLSKATAQVIGDRVAKDLGGSYDLQDIADYLDSNSTGAAKAINATTAQEIQDQIDNLEADENPDDAIDGLFDGQIAARKDQISITRVAIVAGIASAAAATRSKAGEKTWIVNSDKPRPSHADIDGETVAIHETFSNGLRWPGDSEGDADETAGCTCTVEYARSS